MVAPVWGKADPGEKVTVSVAGQSASAVADSNGRWLARLQPLKADGTPVTVTISGKNTLTLNNVLVGEVWVGSGQSNMQYSVAGVLNSKSEIAAANYPKLRLFAVKPFGWPYPLDNVTGKWVECTPRTVPGFSAALYFFGRDLQQEINQPIGLIHSSQGATVVQSWTRWDVLMTDPQTKKQAENRVKQLDDPAWVAKEYAAATAKYKQAQEQATSSAQPLRAPKPEWLGPSYINRPAGLYNAMIHPLLGFAIRGVVWYQGEFNAGDAEQYAHVFPKMIVDWRQQWGEGNFPFLFVQLPENGPLETQPCNVAVREKWAELREAQSKTLSVPNTFMAVTIDTAPGGELHPKNKQPVGSRLALIAANKVYGKQIACDGPTFDSMIQQGNAIRIKFRNAAGGLVTKDGGPVQGFAISGADRKFVWGDARIEGDSVVVSSPAVPEPVSIRYGWANNPLVNIYNKSGLPASPFRTDDWK
ncbi:MAG TPA: sialate O-acetylesterase [Chthoniobacteraceae bacterium]|nr:sialate O-acetylesterase [Chthoniobacteraceae bacterium]